jgi:hypothetical protein
LIKGGDDLLRFERHRHLDALHVVLRAFHRTVSARILNLVRRRRLQRGEERILVE